MEPIKMFFESFFSKYSENDFLYCVNSKRHFTYSEFYTLALKAASLLSHMGVRNNDRIFSSSDNSIELYTFWSASILLGAEIVLIDPKYSNDLIEKIFKKLKPKLFISEKVKLTYCEVLDPNELFITIKNYDPFKILSSNNPNLISFTSGTESLPKGVVRDINSYINNAFNFSNEIRISNSNKNILSTFPGYYLGGFYNLFILPIVNGWKITIIPDFSPSLIAKFWTIVKDHEIDTLWLVPSIVNLLNIFESRKVDSNSKNEAKLVELVLVGTAPLLQKSREQFRENFGLEVIENYALSETLFISSQCQGDSDHSVGALLSFVDVSINSKDEIKIQTPYLLKKYIKLNGSDEVIDRSSDFIAGDLGKFKNHRLTIIGRSKEIIIRGGVNISPKYIEEQLANSKIHEIAVIGIPDEISGERIICFYSAKDDMNSELRSISKSKLSSIFRPEKFIRLDSFPKTGSGKIIKNKLQSLY
jgi:long-chain acyl-CoA synthetase